MIIGESMNKIVRFLRDNYIRFVIYGFVGWLYEVLWFIIVRHEFVNRGVLFGPYLPIYGFGMLILLFLVGKYKSQKHYLKDSINGNIAVATLASFIYITVVEYTTPEKIYRIDYFARDYGVGLMIAIIASLLVRYLVISLCKNKKVRNFDITPIVVCLLVFIITSVIEYVSHYVIDVYFGNILWDYSKDFLNLDARVNFDASRNFALGGTALLYLVEPIILKVTKSRNKAVNIITVLVALIMLIDIICSMLK